MARKRKEQVKGMDEEPTPVEEEPKKKKQKE
jgi:hypothetical protein